jgi:putative membrane protein insertion efficiency factor
MRTVVRILIRGYQITISPVLSLLGGVNSGCRFSPTCSEYFLRAVEEHGVWRGSFLGGEAPAAMSSVGRQRVRSGAGAGFTGAELRLRVSRRISLWIEPRGSPLLFAFLG